MQTSFSIGELAREFGVSLRTLRFYEDKGLISPQRQGLNRIYGRRERGRVRLILMGKRVGFSLDEIKEMLDLYDLKDGRTSQLRLALAPLRRSRWTCCSARSGTWKRAIAELTRTMRVVEGMLQEREADGRSPRTRCFRRRNERVYKTLGSDAYVRVTLR